MSLFLIRLLKLELELSEMTCDSNILGVTCLGTPEYL